MQGIPKEIRVPGQLVHRAKITAHATYVEATYQDVAGRFGMQIVEDSSLGFPTPLSFELGYGPLKVGLDYNDLAELPPCAGEYDFWFKFHSTSAHVPFNNVRAFPPISFHNWRQFREIRSSIRYLALSDKILHVQKTKIVLRAAQWAEDLTRRRSLVRELLRETYGDHVDTEFTDQVAYWQKSSTCLVSVHVPGMWNNMLDRAQIQMMAFGTCTISPVLYTRLPNSQLVPGVHYVAVRDDYSDLLEKIEWCRKHRPECREIGAAASRLFDDNCTPEQIWSAFGRELAKVVIARI